MRKSLCFLAPVLALALVVGARSEYPAGDTGPFLVQAAGQGDPVESAQQTGTGASAAPSDWAAPTEPQLGPDQAPETDGSAPAAIAPDWRPSADPTEMDAAAADEVLGPRVDLGGPGTPKWKVITFISQKTTIDDNIYISHSDKQSNVYFSVAPGFAAGWGDFRSVLLSQSSRFADQYGQTREPVSDPLNGDFAFINYTANATHFLSHDSLDAVDQDAAFSGQWSMAKLLLGLNARFQTLSGADIDTGDRTRRQIYTIGATANYSMSDKTSFDFDAGGEISHYDTELSSSEWHAQLYMDYQWFPKTSIGAGVVAGIRTLQTSPNQYYQQAQLRAAYNATGRLTLNLNGGIEVDEAQGGSTQLNPIFGVGATYAINDLDSVTLNGSRSTSSSAVTTGETEETTSVDFTGRHRIYGGFSLACSVGYTHTDYYNQGLSTLVRTDNYIFVRPSLAYDFAQWSQVELAYEYHRNLSTIVPFDFGENLASLQFNFVF